MKDSVLGISAVATSILVLIVLLFLVKGGITEVTDWSINPYSYPYYSSYSAYTRGPNYFFPYADLSTY